MMSETKIQFSVISIRLGWFWGMSCKTYVCFIKNAQTCQHIPGESADLCEGPGLHASRIRRLEIAWLQCQGARLGFHRLRQAIATSELTTGLYPHVYGQRLGKAWWRVITVAPQPSREHRRRPQQRMARYPCLHTARMCHFQQGHSPPCTLRIQALYGRHCKSVLGVHHCNATRYRGIGRWTCRPPRSSRATRRYHLCLHRPCPPCTPHTRHSPATCLPHIHTQSHFWPQ